VDGGNDSKLALLKNNTISINSLARWNGGRS
jgi:hypothetical protein